MLPGPCQDHLLWYEPERRRFESNATDMIFVSLHYFSSKKIQGGPQTSHRQVCLTFSEPMLPPVLSLSNLAHSSCPDVAPVL